MKPEIVHASDSQRALLDRLERVAPTDAEILISGPSGVGKELYAAFVHAASRRRDKPFVAVNCANLSEDMLENEIFGHARGAFTGAQSGAHGIAATADGGTLFLDEIDALPLPCQAKILRFAQMREYRRLGETYLRRSDVRLIAASNVDLLARVRAGSFREDLYFRLRVVPIEVPPAATACHECEGVPGTQVAVRSPAVMRSSSGLWWSGAAVRAGLPACALARRTRSSRPPTRSDHRACWCPWHRHDSSRDEAARPTLPTGPGRGHRHEGVGLTRGSLGDRGGAGASGGGEM